MVSQSQQDNSDTLEELRQERDELLAQCQNQQILLERQSRLAAIGEIMDSVAHQWKQPINALGMMMEILKSDFAAGEVDTKYIEDLEVDVYRQISHMVNTLREFRNFMRPYSKDEAFFFHEVFAKVLLLMKDELIAQNINLQFDIDNEVILYGNPNEFKHLFLNIINNMIDVFNEREVIKREISVHIAHTSQEIQISISDNAGGIDPNILESIFEANFTTKEDGKGTGIGLYMCRKIAQKYGGSIQAQNHKEGARFTVTLPKKTDSADL